MSNRAWNGNRKRMEAGGGRWVEGVGGSKEQAAAGAESEDILL